MATRKDFSTQYEHCLFYGHSPRHTICYYDYSTLDSLTRKISKVTLISKNLKYVDLIAGNHLSWKVNWFLDSLEMLSRATPRPEAKFLEALKQTRAQSKTWPEAREKIEKLFEKFSQPLTKTLREEIKAADTHYEMMRTGKNSYCLTEMQENGRDKIIEYFDNQHAVIDHMLKLKFEDSGLLVGDQNIANFLRGEKFAMMLNSKKFSPLVSAIRLAIEENRWVLPEAYQISQALDKANSAAQTLNR